MSTVVLISQHDLSFLQCAHGMFSIVGVSVASMQPFNEIHKMFRCNLSNEMNSHAWWHTEKHSAKSFWINAFKTFLTNCLKQILFIHRVTFPKLLLWVFGSAKKFRRTCCWRKFAFPTKQHFVFFPTEHFVPKMLYFVRNGRFLGPTNCPTHSLWCTVTHAIRRLRRMLMASSIRWAERRLQRAKKCNGHFNSKFD